MSAQPDSFDFAASGRRVFADRSRRAWRPWPRASTARSAPPAGLMLACRGPGGLHRHGQVRARRAQDRRHPGLHRHPGVLRAPGRSRHGDLGMITDADVVLALSYSGESDELLMLLPVLKRQGNTVIAMTGRAGIDPGRARPTSTWTSACRPKPARSTSRRPPAPPPRWRWATRWRWRCWRRAASPPTTSPARTRPARWAGACCCTSPTSCTPATTCRGARRTPRVSEALVEMSRKRLGMTAVVDARRPPAGPVHRRRPAPQPGRCADRPARHPHRRGDDPHARAPSTPTRWRWKPRS